MSVSIVLVVVMAVMYASGIYVLLERSLTRLLIGFLLVGNATNLLLFIMSGRGGAAPILVDGRAPEGMVDPLPQVLILTAIVINFGLAALFLGLIYRSWWLARLGAEGDVVPDQHADETSEQAEATFRPATEDEEAIQAALDASEAEDAGAAPAVPLRDHGADEKRGKPT